VANKDQHLLRASRSGSLSELSKGEKITDERLELFRRLFTECDVDGSGSIDKDGKNQMNLLIAK
jgi:hypothetical protein